MAIDFTGGICAANVAVLARPVLIVLSGTPVTITDSTAFSSGKLQILGHYGSDETAVPQLIRLIEAGRLDFARSVLEVLPLDRTANAVERLEHKKGVPIRLVLRP